MGFHPDQRRGPDGKWTSAGPSKIRTARDKVIDVAHNPTAQKVAVGATLAGVAAWQINSGNIPGAIKTAHAAAGAAGLTRPGTARLHLPPTPMATRSAHSRSSSPRIGKDVFGGPGKGQVWNSKRRVWAPDVKLNAHNSVVRNKG